MAPVRSLVSHLALAVVVALGLAFPAAAPAADGIVVPVASPITTDVVTRVKRTVDDALKRVDHRPSVVIFDFNPSGKDAASPEFGACGDFAIHIQGMTDVRTVAYVHRKASGHTVLPILACNEIVVGPQAMLGEIVATGEPLHSTHVNVYKDLITKLRPAHWALVRKMADANAQVRKGKNDGADWYVDQLQKGEFPRKLELTNTAPLKEAPDGVVGLFNADQLRELGLSSRKVDSQQDLLDAFGLSAAALRTNDPLGGKAPVAFRYVLQGQIDGGTKEAVGRVVGDVVRQKGNVLFLQLECAGGDLQAARELADDLRKRQADDNVLIVAFVPDKAPDTAAVIALGCTEIVMSKRKDAASAGEEGAAEAEFGDFEQALGKGAATNVDFFLASLRELLSEQGYPPILADGMLKRDVEIVRVQRKDNRNVRRLMSSVELEDEKAKGPASEWVYQSTVKSKGQLLKLSASKAEEYGLVRHTVDTRNTDELYAKYGIEPGKVKDASPAWLDKFATFLRIPAVTVLLVVIGFTGLILELKVPGTAVPGIIAALCFILVFWAHTQFSGQVAVLAGLLFILGLVLILLEVFVLPGFGAPGVIGVLLMLASLALVTLGTPGGGIPETSEEWGRFGAKIAQYLVAMLVAVGAALLIARYLPNIPYANRLMLTPPTDKPESELESVLPGAALAASLLGAVGTTVTPMRPAGTVRFGDQFIDVVTEGGFIPSGARVQVVEVEGTRIVVKEV
jgi:membrane-bound ClpP family serine protease